MYIDSSREFKNCFISQLIVRINIAYKEIQVMLVKEKKVTGNLTQKQRYKKLISKDTKNSKVLKRDVVGREVGGGFMFGNACKN